MKKIAVTLVGAALLVVPAIAAAQMSGAAGDPAVEKTLLDQERKMNDAVVKRDVATFSSMIATDAWSIDPMGVSPVSEFVKMLKDPKTEIKIDAYELSDMRVLQLNADAAIVMYKWTGSGTFMGQPVLSPSLASTTWVKKGDKWVAVFHQETPVMEPPGQKIEMKQ